MIAHPAAAMRDNHSPGVFRGCFLARSEDFLLSTRTRNFRAQTLFKDSETCSRVVPPQAIAKLRHFGTAIENRSSHYLSGFVTSLFYANFALSHDQRDRANSDTRCSIKQAGMIRSLAESSLLGTVCFACRDCVRCVCDSQHNKPVIIKFTSNAPIARSHQILCSLFQYFFGGKVIFLTASVSINRNVNQPGTAFAVRNSLMSQKRCVFDFFDCLDMQLELNVPHKPNITFLPKQDSF